MRIVSLEDDEPFWDLLKEALEEGFPNAELIWIRTESQFCDRISNFVTSCPDVFLLDVMVKWADAAEEIPHPPKEVVKEGYYRAGLRCRDRLQKNRATKKIPVILFTVLERADIDKVVRKLPAGTAFVGKSGDFRELVTTINHLTNSAQTPTRVRP